MANTANPEADRFQELEDALKNAERRIAETRADRDKAYELVGRMSEHVKDARTLIDSWKEAFDMQLGENGMWSFQDGFGEKYDALLVKHNALVKQWNRFVPVLNPQPIGRPLAASDAQCATVRRMHKAGSSLRNIVDETNLTLQTVRTIVGREHQTDRTSIKRLQRIDPERAAAITERSRKRTRAGLPKRINQLLADGDALVKEAKGLGD